MSHVPFCRGGAQPLEQFRKDGFLVEARHDNRNFLHDGINAVLLLTFYGPCRKKKPAGWKPALPLRSERIFGFSIAFFWLNFESETTFVCQKIPLSRVKRKLPTILSRF